MNEERLADIEAQTQYVLDLVAEVRELRAMNERQQGELHTVRSALAFEEQKTRYAETQRNEFQAQAHTLRAELVELRRRTPPVPEFFDQIRAILERNDPRPKS